MIVTDLKNTMHTFSLETGLRRTPEPSPGRDTPSSLPQITVSGDRLWLRYESELLILDADGQLVGSDATSRTQGHTLEALAPFSDGLVLVSHVRNQPSFRTSAGLRGSGHQHRLHVLSPGGRTEDLVDLYQLDSKIRAARAVHDALLLSTDDEILTVTLPPALAPGQPGP